MSKFSRMVSTLLMVRSGGPPEACFWALKPPWEETTGCIPAWSAPASLPHTFSPGTSAEGRAASPRPGHGSLPLKCSLCPGARLSC